MTINLSKRKGLARAKDLVRRNYEPLEAITRKLELIREYLRNSGAGDIPADNNWLRITLDPFVRDNCGTYGPGYEFSRGSSDETRDTLDRVIEIFKDRSRKGEITLFGSSHRSRLMRECWVDVFPDKGQHFRLVMRPPESDSTITLEKESYSDSPEPHNLVRTSRLQLGIHALYGESQRGLRSLVDYVENGGK